MLGVGSAYQALNPYVPKKESRRGVDGMLMGVFMNSLTYEFDKDETAFYRVKNLVARYADINHITKSSMLPNEKSKAAFLVKRSMYYGDYEAAERNLVKYISLRGTLEGIQKSLKLESPLYMLKKEFRAHFLRTLDEEDYALFKRGMNWYNKMYLRKVDSAKLKLLYRKAKVQAYKEPLKTLYYNS
jgi:hypothetical protein